MRRGRHNALVQLQGSLIRAPASAGVLAQIPCQLQRTLGRRRVGLEEAASGAAIRRDRQALVFLELDACPEARFGRAIDPSALRPGPVAFMIQNKPDLHCFATLGTRWFAVCHGVSSEDRSWCAA